MSVKRAVLFDLGNTLLYFDAAWPDVFARADQELVTDLKRAGLKLDRKEFTQTFRARLEAYYAQRESEFIEHTTTHVLTTLLAENGYDDISDEILLPALERMYAVSQEHWLPEQDAIPCLEALREQGYKLAIVSNAGDDADVQLLVDKNDLRQYFECGLTSAECGIRKPNPRIFDIALERLNISPQDAVMVGDKLGADILGARNAGIYSIWVTRRADIPANRDHEDTIKPDVSINSLQELPALLSSLS